MKFTAMVLFLALAKSRALEYWAETKVVTPENSTAAFAFTAKDAEATLVALNSKGVPADNGGNYGDLIHRHRENRDRILLREVIINQELASVEQDIVWSVSISGVRVSSVRVLNFGRQRAYCLRIDVAAGDVQVIIRIPPLYDPRVMIEIYGF